MACGAPRLRCGGAGSLRSSLNFQGQNEPAWSGDAGPGVHLLYLEAEPAALPQKSSFDSGGLVLISNARIKEKNERLSDRNF